MKQNVNLYRPAARSGGGRLDAKRMLAGWTIALAATAMTQTWLEQRSGGAERELRRVVAEVESTQTQLNELTATMMAGADTALETRLSEALRELDLRETVLGLVSGSGAGDTGGFSAQLRSLARQRADGVWLTRVRVSAPGGRTTLEGRALSPEAVPIYLRQLSGETALAGQRFDELEIQRPENEGEPIRFSLNHRDKAHDVRLARE